MTGLDARRHRVIEICIERWRGDVQEDRLESLVRPEPLTETVGNHHVHGIDAASLESAPTFAELLPRIDALLDGAAMIAHGARWDAAFLRAETRRAGHEPERGHHLDTLALARRLIRAESHGLAALAESLGIANERPHRAANDVAVTRGLFAHLVALMRECEPRPLTPRVLWERCVGKSIVSPEILDAAQHAIDHGQLTSVCYRASRRAPQQLQFVVTEVRRDLDPPVVLGYLHHTRGPPRVAGGPYLEPRAPLEMKLSNNFRQFFALSTLIAASFVGWTSCSPSADHPESVRPPRAQKWYDRALKEYREVDIDAAQHSTEQALEIVPQDSEVKILAGRVALARLEWDNALQLLKGVPGTEAAKLRGRAHWYKGDLEATVRELETVLADPEVEDNWATEIIKLATEGAGARQPFTVTTTNGRLETVQMAKVAGVKLFIVSVEIDGDNALALVSTGSSEVMIDSTTRTEPTWVSLRFGERVEVKDVPALPKDLSELSRQLGAPIKAMLGANLLRKLRVTLDHRGRQFVARSFDPSPPPVASRVDVFYMRGGGMVLAGGFGKENTPRVSFHVDTSMAHALALDSEGWTKAGIDVMKLPELDDGAGREVSQGQHPAADARHVQAARDARGVQQADHHRQDGEGVRDRSRWQARRGLVGRLPGDVHRQRACVVGGAAASRPALRWSAAAGQPAARAGNASASAPRRWQSARPERR